MPNHLINETSPYLQQHANNPVDWYPWGTEAFLLAKQLNKPILLSIGYSACHWCHVMERESFENQTIAKLMNDNFINIKVDREERPDIDSIYMTAVQALTGHGGWPMTVFLTPEREPFYGGTYFPPEGRHGMPGFPQVLETMANVYKEKPEDIERASSKLLTHMKNISDLTNQLNPSEENTLHQAFASISAQFDSANGGFGTAPKFPQPMIYEFLLQYYYLTKNESALNMVETSLQHMAFGGIHDHIGGGFHRYSTDSYWLVPHFEKMLYDNALLVRLYLHTFQITNKDIYQRVAKQILNYLLREMCNTNGSFVSSQDADTEGNEGGFFSWTSNELNQHLGPKVGPITARFYGVTDSGNFEGSNILHIPQKYINVYLGESDDKLYNIIHKSNQILLNARNKRSAPMKDNKVIMSWNCLMITTLAEAGAILQSNLYINAAIKCADFLLDNLIQDGRVNRTYRQLEPKLNGYLEDYSFLINALLTLHGATLESKWLTIAISLANSMIELFWDPDKLVFYDTGVDHETLILRPKDAFDNALPSGSSVAVEVLLKLGVITGDSLYSNIGTKALDSLSTIMPKMPMGLPNWLCNLNFHLSSVKEIVILGSLEDPKTKSILNSVHKYFVPNKVVIGQVSELSIPLLIDRAMLNESPTAFICENYVCQMPTNDPSEVERQLIN